MVFSALAFILFVGVDEDWTYLGMLPSFLSLGIAFTLAYGIGAVHFCCSAPYYNSNPVRTATRLEFRADVP